ncbi:MAG TPA: acyclic terpene utilization AtuA family protein, partial [Pirellulaceae bacterium]|nr:acyclic terpene utilization AtuA family protein [Pirellulaceae bacterium]
MTLRIANAAGFWGDQPSAARQLVEASTVDYLTLEYLAELTMSILARLREKDPQAGYATDFIDVLHSLKSLWPDQPQLKIITNAGGMNPLACATKAAELLAEHQLGALPVGVVTGDDLLPRIADLLRTGQEFINLDTGAPLSSLTQPIVSANAYLGARPIASALDQGARLVITGRVADASLTVGPAMHAFQTNWTNWDALAAYSVAGHLIE